MKIQNTLDRKTNQPGETESLTLIGDAACEYLMKPAVSSLITPDGLKLSLLIVFALY